MANLTPIMIDKWFWPKTRKSHPLSKLLRPIFGGKRPKKSFGIFLIVVVFLSGLLLPSASAFETYKSEELVALAAEVEINTQKATSSPLKDVFISQGYWLFPPAVDIVAPRNAPVYPIMTGVIEKVESGHFGYGNNIIVDHGNKIKSRYAHLSKIVVEKGRKVTQEAIIGKVGSTGWASGNHLHLEIKENGKYLNPKAFLR